MTGHPFLPGLRRLLLFWFLALIPFQDTVLRQGPLGYLGSSLAVLPLAGLLALDLFDWQKLQAMRVRLPLFAALSYAALVSLVSLLIYGTVWQDVDLLVKSAVLFACLGIALYSTIGLDYADQNCIRWGCATGFGVCLAGILFGDLNVLGMESLVRNPLLHAGPDAGDRWRGLSTEASTLSVTVVSLALLCAVLARRTAAKAVYLTCGFATVAMTYSKGGIASLLISAAVLCILRPRVLPLVAGASFVFLPLLYFAWTNLLVITTDQMISETTTVATRSALAIWSAMVLFDHPLGVGFSGFYPALTAYLPEAMDAIHRWAPLPLNFSEVSEYRNSGQFASTKSLLLNYSVYFGLPGCVALLWAPSRLIRFLARRGETLLCVALLFVTIALATYIESPFLFAPSVIIGLALERYAAA